MIDADEVRALIEQAIAASTESGVAVTIEYVDKSMVYDNVSGDLTEKRDIEIRVRAVPPVISE